MTILSLLASTFGLVFALGLQSQLVNNGHFTAAFVNSLAIGACNLVLFKLAPNASGAEIAAYLLGGPFGIVASMAAYRHPLTARLLLRLTPETGMNAATYSPRSDSLASHVLGFFKLNPDEHLSLDDITTKWQATRGNIHTLLMRAVQEQLLTRTRNDDGEYIYEAGPALIGSEVPEPAAAKREAPSGFSSPRLQFDLESLKVEDGIPFTPGGRKGQTKWEPLFEKLTKPGHSVAIPGVIKGAVLAAAMKRNRERRGTFRVQMTGPGAARVWRIE